jgi:endonuclease/exonuclease/phosphatase family metal-dependent hydrolase
MEKSLLAIALPLLVIVIALLMARTVYPAKNQSGHGFDGAARDNDDSEFLRVATYNIQTGKSLQGKRNIDASAEVLKTADLVAVQEVYGAGWLNRIGIGQDQTRALANTGGFMHLFAATRYRWFREQRGNTTLSKLPIGEWRILMLPDQSRKSPRNMTVARFIWGGEEAVFINTHLHTGKGRLEQLEAVLSEFMRHPRVILAGDFNTRGDATLLRDIVADASVIDAIAAAGLTSEGSDRIDWILTRGFDVVSGRELPKGISDHPYFEVTLR